MQQGTANPTINARLQRGGIVFELDTFGEWLYQKADGKATIRSTLANIANRAEAEEPARLYYQHMWRGGHMFMSLKAP